MTAIDSTALLFERIYEVFSRPWDPEAARRVIARASEGARPWTERCGEIGQSLGLRLTILEAPATEIEGLVGHRHPVLTVDSQASESWWLLVDRDGRRIKVITPLRPEGEWMDPGTLATALAEASPGTRRTWCAVDLAEPMSSLAAHPSALERVWALARMEREDLKVVAIFAVITGLLSLVTPIAVQSLVNTTAFGTVLQPLVVLTLVVCGVLGLSATLSALEVQVVELMQRRLVVRVVGDLAHRLPRLRPGAFGAHYGPEQLNRFFDVFTIQKTASSLLIDGLSLVLTTTAGLVLLAFYHPILLAFDLVLVAALALILFGLGRGTVRTSIQESKKKYAVAAWLEELAREHDLFRGEGGRQLATDRADRLTREYLYARAEHFKLVLRQTVASYGLQAVSSGALLGVGGFLVFEGQLTLGQLVAAELVVTTVVGAFAKMGKQLDNFYDLAASADKLGHLFDLPTLKANGERPPSPEPRGSRLRLADLSVKAGERPVFEGLSLSLECGDRVALQGPSGSGKTLLAEALSGRRAHYAGYLELDGMDVRDFDPVDHYRRVLLIRPGEVFCGTILDNLRVGDHQVEDHQIREALGKLGLLDAILAFPEGLQTELLPTGAPLSRTQLSALLIARALVHRPSLLVADGVLDELDEETRRAAALALTDPEAPWTLLVTTDRPTIGAHIGRTLRLEQGRLLEVQS